MIEGYIHGCGCEICAQTRKTLKCDCDDCLAAYKEDYKRRVEECGRDNMDAISAEVDKKFSVQRSDSPMYQFAIVKNVNIKELLSRYSQLSIDTSKCDDISVNDINEKKEIESLLTAALENYILPKQFQETATGETGSQGLTGALRPTAQP